MLSGKHSPLRCGLQRGISMDWVMVHRWVEEANLWTSLAINIWLILTGVIFIRLVIRRRGALPTSDEVVISAFTSLVYTISASIIGGSGLYFDWKYPNLRLDHPYIGQFSWIMLIAILLILLAAMGSVWIHERITQVSARDRKTRTNTQV